MEKERKILWYNKENIKPTKNRMLFTFKKESLFMGAAFLVGSFFIFNSAQAATTYYVSPTGSDTNSGTSSAPFKTIQKAADIVVSGDTVIVRDGIYTDTNGDDDIIRLSHGGSSWITFKAENKGKAILDCQNNATNYAVHSSSANSNYLAFEGFEIKGCAKSAFIFNLGEHDIRIKDNNIHDIARRTDNTLVGFPAIYSGNNTLRFTIDSNIFRNIGRLNPYTTPSAPAASCTTPSDYVYNGTSYPNLSVCYNHDHAMYLNSDNNVIINNVFYGDFKSGWMVLQTTNASGGKIINNTFYGDNNGRPGQVLIQGPNQTINNNIFYADGSCGIATYTAGSPSGTYNNNSFGPGMSAICNDADALFRPAGTWTNTGNIMSVNPLFANVTAGDFHLQSTSPAIGKGLLTGSPLLDFDGVTRGSSIDLGAYEYAAGGTPPPTDTTSPANPTGLQVQ